MTKNQYYRNINKKDAKADKLERATASGWKPAGNAATATQVDLSGTADYWEM